MISHPNRTPSVYTTEAAARAQANVSEFGTYMDVDVTTWYFMMPAPGRWGEKTSVIAVSRDLDALKRRLNGARAIYRGFALPGATIWADTAKNMAADRVA